MTPRIRVITKVGAFSFALFFIFFFVVHGYRYADGVGFMTKNAYYEAQFRSDGQKVFFDNTEYTATDKKVQLFNIDEGCYNVIYKDIHINKCLYRNSVTIDTFATYITTKPHEDLLFSSCAPIQRLAHGEYTIKGHPYGRPIQEAFIAREMSFLYVDNILYSCTSNYNACQPITHIDAVTFMCSEKAGLVYNKDGKLFMMGLE